ncbi:MAG: type I restriction enzyme HsdR N-terminal domain-containing protein [Prevotella sp.]|nr:type I restriction enzyme HsdR N-terminal domain-containing protein [Prevotella sp.]
MEINLPSYEIKLRERSGKREIFDFLRRRYVALTPEEWVRQHFVHFLIEHKGYPKGLLANELELRVGEKRMRCDTVVYDSSLHPKMIVEYKAPDVVITQRVFNQITVYNMQLHVDYLIVSNGLQHFCCRMDYAQGRYDFLEDIPAYAML